MALGPGMHTLRIPVNQMTPDEQAYFIGIRITIRDHAAVGNLVWTITELRSVGTALTTRTLASHDAGRSITVSNGADFNF